MKKWFFKNVPFDVSIITKRYNVSEAFAKVLVNRKFKNLNEMDEYLYPEKVKLKDAFLMKDMEGAVKLLNSKKNCKIFVVGDYDVDGVMSTYILVKGLRTLGHEVGYRLPHREKDGYGIRDYMADEAKEFGADILMTCDNGISAVSAIEHAKKIGLDVIVTDHHEVPTDENGEIKVPADLTVDPKQSECAYPFKDMCGAGICYRLIQLLCNHDKKYNPMLVQLMIPAAIATVCDVVPLKGENRVIVRYGLKYINGKCSIVGLNELIKLCNFKKQIGGYDFGFRIGPCINAAGRLESAEKSLELMLEEDESKAHELAAYLVDLNENRKTITEQGVDAAIEYIEENNLLEKKILLVYVPDLSEAVAGIVAGRLREKYFHPVMVAVDAKGREGIVKASGRSIPAYHMQKGLNQIKDLLSEYGGHALAAGFSFEKDKLEEIYAALEANANLTEDDFVEKVYFDAEVPLKDATKQLVDELALMEPFGAENDSAKFVKRNVLIKRVFLCGKENKVGRFIIEDEGQTYNAVDFNVDVLTKPAIVSKYNEQAWESLVLPGFEGVSVDIMYAPDFNDYNNTVQFKIIDIR
ncbi:MAG: single-stranded-DNA-specific exonuclease RecJ [Lachnospiraceae bacterium]|nr:single-stranded-DNA-specific exonuclease RecJ [Lachnospiraceae bacterium]